MSNVTEPTPSSTPSESPSLVNTPAPVPVEAGPVPATPAPGTPPATEGEAPKVEAPPAPAPEPLTMEQIKLPEGFTVDEEVSKNFLDVMNDDKLTAAERGQKLIDMQTNLMTKAAETIADANTKVWDDMQTKWQDEIRADPEIGGDKLEPALGEISKLIDRYGSSQELRQALDLTGAGNNPHMIRFLHSIAKDLSEGGPVSGAPSLAKESLADRMYPSMTKKQGA